MTGAMSLAVALARIDQIERALVPAPAPEASQPSSPVAAAATAGATSGSFSNVLQGALAPAAAGMPTGGTAPAIVAIAEGEVGQAEQPPGSNDGPAIAMYRSAVEGSYAGAPWCAYFVSWSAAQAGTPIGDRGQGLGSVAAITDWAGRTGRLVSQPQPGDLILFGSSHVGIVQSVNADGSLTTVEGNASNAVSVEQHSPSDATGFVRL